MSFSDQEYTDKSKGYLIRTIKALSKALDSETERRYKIIRESAMIYNQLEDIKGKNVLNNLSFCLN